MIITIDGAAGTGKTSLARLLAKRLNFAHIDTGAMYRAVTYALLQQKIALTDIDSIETCLSHFDLSLQKHEDRLRYFMQGEEVTEKIRSQTINDVVSQVAQIAPVRTAMVTIQRKLAEGVDAVAEGRDLGSVVFPQATLKFFLTARLEICAQRRYQEIRQKEQQDPTDLTEQQVLQSLAQRNELDSTRKISPLVQPDNAIVIDTSDLSIEQVLMQMLQHYHQVHRYA